MAAIDPDWINNHIWQLLGGGIGLALLLALIPKFELVADSISRFFGWVAMGTLLAMALLVFYDITSRKFFGGGSIGVEEMEWHLYAVTFLFGIGYTMAMDKHVRVDILYSRYPLPVKWGVDLVALLFFVIPLSILVITQALPFVADSYLQHERSGDPGGLCCRWIIKSMMVVGFTILYLQAAGEIRKRVLKLVHYWRERKGSK